MKSLPHNKITKNPNKQCSIPSCFLCTINQPDPFLRAKKITQFFKQMPQTNDPESVISLNGLWTVAMTRPDNPEFPELGVFECMAKLIWRGIKNKEWLFRNQNIYIPYYAAHIIGSYVMNRVEFAEIGIESGVIPPLMELLRGKFSWVEQRVAIRALFHLASHEKTFRFVAEFGGEIVELALDISLKFVENVYKQFLCLKQRSKYQRNLLTRGVDRVEIENKKTEKWVIQTQCWSVRLLDCFARNEKHLNLICERNFLKNLCRISTGIRLLKTLCKTEIGRNKIAGLEEILNSLCFLARSSDEYQITAIECLLSLIKDPKTRNRVLESSVFSLADLTELENSRGFETTQLGDTITRELLKDYHKIKFGNQNLYSERAEKELNKIWELKVEKNRTQKLMSEKGTKQRKHMVGVFKKQGNHKFKIGDFENAAINYTKGLKLSLPKMRKQRLVLYSNRAQCFLLMRNPESAISDATRALCLSKQGNPHCRSLWRRSQAYDMIGLGKESLMDCLNFVKCRINLNRKIPYYAARMIDKQMNANWVFGSVKLKVCNGDGELDGESLMAECER